jgi:UDP-N-acetyl-D-galactosamine dehydrogenase
MSPKVAVIGLGYVGLPLAIAFGRYFETIGFDTSESLVKKCLLREDPHGDLDPDDFERAARLTFTHSPELLRSADFIIIAVPTPVDIAHQPDFSPLISASQEVGRYMKRGAVVVYESTVYPGATEEICIPELERSSGLKWLQDFNVGYSPERINPGDREHLLSKVTKVVSGDTPAILERVAELYGTIVTKGVFRASSIKVAEAAKVIENTQRDLNIALMNELSLLFHYLGIDTMEVLEAAGTKWNFLPFRPGLVGGHCIGVDPYYLTYKAETVRYYPEVILAGRRINDHMGHYVGQQTVKNIIQAGFELRGAVVNVLGMTFKENCPDLRNSRIIDIIEELHSYGINVHVHDPVADPDVALREYGVQLTSWANLPAAQAVIVAVSHRNFLDRPLVDYQAKLVDGGIFMDVKAGFDKAKLCDLGYVVWRL